MLDLHRGTWVRLGRVVRQFFASEVRGKARLLFGVLIALLLTISGLNVVNSYVGRDFMTALADRRAGAFYPLALLYVGVFAASTAVAAFQSYAQARLGLLWRKWLTDRLVGCYLRGRAYYRLRARAGVDNPDERISEDVRAFTDTALGFVVLLMNGAITVVAFAGVTWSISPLLFGVCVGYALLGSTGILLLGRRLAALNARQLAREADFRAALLHVRENALAVALTGAEAPLRHRLAGRLGALVANFCRIISVNLRLSFFSGGYGYLVQIIPALVVGPLYMRGEVPFGVVTQAAMAFAQLSGALSLVVTQFQSLSSFAAVVSRVNELEEALEEAAVPAGPPPVQTVETPDRVAFEGLTLWRPEGEKTLVKALTAAVERGQRLSITGRNEAGQEALFLAVASLWETGRGRIERPPLSETRFVTQTPYLVPGTLRDQFRADDGAAADDARILAALEAVGLEGLAERVGGLDAEREWPHLLTLGEQQAVALARVLFIRPRFALLDRLGTALGSQHAAEILERLEGLGIGLVTFLGTDEPIGPEGAVLELNADGLWSLHAAAAGQAASGQRA